MASHGYLGDPGEYTPSRYHWQCPLCPYELTAVTEGGRRSLSGFHMDGHVRKDRERMALFASMPDRTPEYYQILRLTWADIQFLRTRKIKIEADMEWIDCGWTHD
jgi:hypothetical protein